jgi:hypothetical protein
MYFNKKYLLFHVFILLVFLSSGAWIGWTKGNLWLNAHPEFDQSEDEVWCYLDAIVGAGIGIFLGTGLVSCIKFHSKKEAFIKPANNVNAEMKDFFD